jgi:hypothetical protein
LFEKFAKKIHCSSCGKDVVFELIQDIECDWGSHEVIQCPNCEELFSIDKQCLAFQDVFNLILYNNNLLTEKEKSEYVKDPHC